jgi:hypothetical protein
MPMNDSLDNVLKSEKFGNIFYREVTHDVDLNTIAGDIRLAFSAFYNFRASWAFVVTWHEVGSLSWWLNNTFQAVLATNGQHSFAIFNYGRLDWFSSGKNIFAQVSIYLASEMLEKIYLL